MSGKKPQEHKNRIMRMYDILEKYFGDLGWWPAETDFEVIVGAILTQNTAWTNVEKAIRVLKDKRLLDPRKIVGMKEERLSRVIRSAGYHRLKAQRLKAVSRFILTECNGALCRLKKKDTGELRKRFLSVNGIGPETADSILLYALGKPVFVVDAYARRIFSRHALAREDDAYEDIQFLVRANFPMKEKTLNRFHAFLVETAKRFCGKRKKICEECPLGKMQH
ncbi:MAG: hypothetical protein ABIH74_03270 [Candidatus Omnitrophota bacterium]